MIASKRKKKFNRIKLGTWNVKKEGGKVSASTFIIITYSITTLSIKGIFVALSLNDL
jgi:hypothetical protein